MQSFIVLGLVFVGDEKFYAYFTFLPQREIVSYLSPQFVVCNWGSFIDNVEVIQSTSWFLFLFFPLFFFFLVVLVLGAMSHYLTRSLCVSTILTRLESSGAPCLYHGGKER
jgi:hypothetical protein